MEEFRCGWWECGLVGDLWNLLLDFTTFFGFFGERCVVFWVLDHSCDDQFHCYWWVFLMCLLCVRAAYDLDRHYWVLGFDLGGAKTLLGCSYWLVRVYSNILVGAASLLIDLLIIIPIAIPFALNSLLRCNKKSISEQRMHIWGGIHGRINIAASWGWEWEEFLRGMHRHPSKCRARHYFCSSTR